MIRAIIKIPSAPPIDAAIMGNRGLDEWPRLLAPVGVEEVVGLCCVEEVVVSNSVGEAVAPNCVEGDVPSTRPKEAVGIGRWRNVVVVMCSTIVFGGGSVCVGCGVAPAGVRSGAVNPGGQPNALQASTKQQPVYAGLAHDHNEYPPVHAISLLVVCWAVERKS